MVGVILQASPGQALPTGFWLECVAVLCVWACLPQWGGFRLYVYILQDCLPRGQRSPVFPEVPDHSRVHMDVRWVPLLRGLFLRGSVVSGADRKVKGVEPEGVKDKRFSKQVPSGCFVFSHSFKHPKGSCQAKRRAGVREGHAGHSKGPDRETQESLREGRF